MVSFTFIWSIMVRPFDIIVCAMHSTLLSLTLQIFMRCLELIRRAKLLTEVCKQHLIELHVVVGHVCMCARMHQTVGKNLFSLY